MDKTLNILILDIAGSPELLKRVRSFFNEESVSLHLVNDVSLFETLMTSKSRKFIMAIALVNIENNTRLKKKYPLPTFAFLPGTYTYNKLQKFYMENGGGDG